MSVADFTEAGWQHEFAPLPGSPLWQLVLAISSLARTQRSGTRTQRSGTRTQPVRAVLVLVLDEHT